MNPVFQQLCTKMGVKGLQIPSDHVVSNEEILAPGLRLTETAAGWVLAENQVTHDLDTRKVTSKLQCLWIDNLNGMELFMQAAIQLLKIKAPV